MASIDLTGIPLALAEPMALDFGASVEPATGGRRTWVDRLGSRWAWRFETATMKLEPQGRLWSEKLDRARRVGALIALEQPDLNVGAPGSPVVRSSTATGRTVPVQGATPGYAVKAGSWVSLVVDGQRYLDRVTEQVVADATGEMDLTLRYLIRAPLSVGDVVELGRPKIEGVLEDLAGGAWSNDRVTSFVFTITEEA